jgi:probable rRNA maturation factor
MAIYYFVEDVQKIKIPKRKVNLWIKECIAHHNKKTGNINIVFCSDEYLKEMNIQYMKHDYYTDIITFNNNDNDLLSGDLYISTERVQDNAKLYSVDILDELLRVIIHGILHLIGFNDTNNELKKEIKNQEDEWLKVFKSFK